MNKFILLLLLFVHLVLARKIKRWQIEFDPEDILDYHNGYNWKIQKYWKWPLSQGEPPHFVVMAEPYYQNGNPVPYEATTNGMIQEQGAVYSFELYPAGDAETKLGTTAGIDTFVSARARVSPSWTPSGEQIELLDYSPYDLVQQFMTVSDESFNSGKAYRLLGSVVGGQNCIDFSNTFFNKLQSLASTTGTF
jgi:hypothetical protein